MNKWVETTNLIKIIFHTTIILQKTMESLSVPWWYTLTLKLKTPMLLHIMFRPICILGSSFIEMKHNWKDIQLFIRNKKKLDGWMGPQMRIEIRNRNLLKLIAIILVEKFKIWIKFETGRDYTQFLGQTKTSTKYSYPKHLSKTEPIITKFSSQIFYI